MPPPASSPTFYLFAGCNGAGKTTFARAYLRQLDPIPRFLNADELARGLSPLNVQAVAIKAGKLLIHEIDDCLKTSNSFGLESTLSGTTYTRTLQRAKALGYSIEIHYLWLPSPELAIRRIAQRVKMGGHFIPAADVRRRFIRSRSNFLHLYDPKQTLGGLGQSPRTSGLDDKFRTCQFGRVGKRFMKTKSSKAKQNQAVDRSPARTSRRQSHGQRCSCRAQTLELTSALMEGRQSRLHEAVSTDIRAYPIRMMARPVLRVACDFMEWNTKNPTFRLPCCEHGLRPIGNPFLIRAHPLIPSVRELRLLFLKNLIRDVLRQRGFLTPARLPNPPAGSSRFHSASDDTNGP